MKFETAVLTLIFVAVVKAVVKVSPAKPAMAVILATAIRNVSRQLTVQRELNATSYLENVIPFVQMTKNVSGVKFAMRLDSVWQSTM